MAGRKAKSEDDLDLERLVTDRLQEKREALGLSRQTVAESLGVKRETIIAWEQGRRCPRISVLRQWATLVGFPSLSHLLAEVNI